MPFQGFLCLVWFGTEPTYTSRVVSTAPSIDLSHLHTFGFPAKASRVESFTDVDSLRDLLKETSAPHLILGEGSNVAFVDDFSGTILLNRIEGRNIVPKEGEDAIEVIAGAGEDWHELVRWTLDQGIFGLENLSLIPGRVGASPIQNIGAYGVELSDVFSRCRALDLNSDQVVFLDKEDCKFGYRDSIFKREKGRFVILDVHFELSRTFEPNLAYGDLAQQAAGLENTLNGLALSDLVSEIRRKKLPHPCDLGNAGSFFKNPVINSDLKDQLLSIDSSAPVYEVADGMFKTSAAWLIDQCGLKGSKEGQIAVHVRQPLVLVNLGEGTGQQLLSLSMRIQDVVHNRFGIELKREVNLIPSPEGPLR